MMVGFLYTVFIGVPACCACMAVGLMLCITVVGIAPGLTLMALGVKLLTLPPPRR